MSLRRRILRLTERLGPPQPPRPPMSTGEILHGLQRLIDAETYNRGIFDSDPEFRPAWSHYHDLWAKYTHGFSSLDAVWLRRVEPDFEEARQRVVQIMSRVARQQPPPFNGLAEVLECLEKDFENAAGVRHETETPDQPPRTATSAT